GRRAVGAEGFGAVAGCCQEFDSQIGPADSVIAMDGDRLGAVAEVLLMKIIVAANVRRPEFEAMPARAWWNETGEAPASFQMPLADETGVISALSQDLDDGLLFRRQWNIVYGNTAGMRILPCK